MTDTNPYEKSDADEEEKNVGSQFNFGMDSRKDETKECAEGIPNERVRPNVIPLVPSSNYIKNERHFRKYKQPAGMRKQSEDSARLSAGSIRLMIPGSRGKPRTNRDSVNRSAFAECADKLAE